MTNQEYYEGLCEKARKYDLLQQEKEKLQKTILKYEEIFVEQQSQIKKWVRNSETWAELHEKDRAEIERLQIRLRKVRNQFTDLSKMHSEIKSEAIKDYTKFLIDEIGIIPGDDRYDFYICEDDVLEVRDKYLMTRSENIENNSNIDN